MASQDFDMATAISSIMNLQKTELQEIADTLGYTPEEGKEASKAELIGFIAEARRLEAVQAAAAAAEADPIEEDEPARDEEEEDGNGAASDGRNNGPPLAVAADGGVFPHHATPRATSREAPNHGSSGATTHPNYQSSTWTANSLSQLIPTYGNTAILPEGYGEALFPTAKIDMEAVIKGYPAYRAAVPAPPELALTDYKFASQGFEWRDALLRAPQEAVRNILAVTTQCMVEGTTEGAPITIQDVAAVHSLAWHAFTSMSDARTAIAFDVPSDVITRSAPSLIDEEAKKRIQAYKKEGAGAGTGAGGRGGHNFRRGGQSGGGGNQGTSGGQGSAGQTRRTGESSARTTQDGTTAPRPSA